MGWWESEMGECRGSGCCVEGVVSCESVMRVCSERVTVCGSVRVVWVLCTCPLLHEGR